MSETTPIEYEALDDMSASGATLQDVSELAVSVMESSISPNASAPAVQPTSSDGKVVQLRTTTLREHDVAKLLPNISTTAARKLCEEAADHGIDRPIMVCADRTTVFFGFHELQAAKDAKLETVPCLVVAESDPQEYAMRKSLLIPQFSRDQLELLAWRYKQHLSDRRKKERSVKACSMRSQSDPPSLSVQRADKTGAKMDSRNEAAKLFNVSERALRSLDAIAKSDSEAGGGSLIEMIQQGTLTIKDAFKSVRAQQKEAEDDATTEAASDTEEIAYSTAPAAVECDGWIYQDNPYAFLAGPTVALLILDGMTEDQMAEALKASLPHLVDTGAVLCVTNFDGEGAVRRVFDNAGLHLSRPFVIDASAYMKGQLGKRHLSVLIGTRTPMPTLHAAAPEKDILTEVSADSRPAIYRRLVEMFSEHGDLVFQPLAPDAAAYIGSRLSQRTVLAVAKSEEIRFEEEEFIGQLLSSDDTLIEPLPKGEGGVS